MLEPNLNPASRDNLIVTAFGNLAEAVACLQRADLVDQTPESRESARAEALHQIGCLQAHFQGALDTIPAAEASS